MKFTQEELEEMARADAEIEEEFDGLTPEEEEFAEEFDMETRMDEALEAGGRKADHLRYRLEHAEQCKEKARAYYQSHKEQQAAYLKKYRAEHREQVNAAARKRTRKRQLEKGGPGKTPFAKRLWIERTQASMSREYVADAVGISVNTLGEYERGVVMPPFINVVLLAKVLNVSLDYLAGGDVNKSIGDIKLFFGKR